ncbi:MAG TPA: hypothetical protein VKT27_13260 [Candidatus Binataceae bacterium]|nr:hypothetical protein [Candidatus Binataceae bacterium]
MAASPAALIETFAQVPKSASIRTLENRQIAEFAGVFRGRELTRKDRRLSSGIAPLDAILDGGIVRGRISEIVARPGFGRTSLAASIAASATRRGEVAAWIDSSGAFDPASVAAAGADLSRILWVGADAAVRAGERDESPASGSMRMRSGAAAKSGIKTVLLAAEMILNAGGFGLVAIDIGALVPARTFTLSAALRLARAAERSGAAVIVMAERRTCGTFAALSLVLGRVRPCFSRSAPGAPALFDGMRVEAYVARNKLGGSGRAAAWRALVDPSSASFAPSLTPSPLASSSTAPSPASLISVPSISAVRSAPNRDRVRMQSRGRRRRSGADDYAR